MTFLAPLALRFAPVKRILSRIPTWAWIALAVALVAFAGWRWHVGEVRHADRQGYARAMAEVNARIERDRVAQQRRESTATINLEREKAADNAAATARQSEIDNATKALPDRPLSDRQRARACLELLRAGKAPPDCRAYASP